MEKKKKRIFYFVVILLLGIGIWYFWLLPQEPKKTPNIDIEEKKTVIPTPLPIKRIDNLSDDPRVSLAFHDAPEIQIKWVERGEQIAVEDHPSADRAEVKNNFFHRGFKFRQVGCGEIAFWKGQEQISDYQKYIFVGMRSVYYETQIENFDILWDKLCKQTFKG